MGSNNLHIYQKNNNLFQFDMVAKKDMISAFLRRRHKSASQITARRTRPMTRTPLKSGRNTPLKLAIVASGKTQRDIAALAQLGEVRLSAIITGRIVPSPEEKRAIAKALRRPQGELFTDQPAVA